MAAEGEFDVAMDGGREAVGESGRSGVGEVRGEDVGVTGVISRSTYTKRESEPSVGGVAESGEDDAIPNGRWWSR